MLDYIIYAVLGLLLLWNIIVFMIYGADKSKAKKNKRRISERTLLVSAFLMGGIGAFLGMIVLRHKTKHIRFKILLPLAAILNIAAYVAMSVPVNQLLS